MIRVAIVDDQALVRAGFRALLEAEDDMQVVGEAADGGAALRVVASMSPDVVLMDIRMPSVDGIEATRRIAEDPRLGGVRIVILTTFETDEYLFDALRAGAAGFLVKDIDPVELLRAIRVVAQGDALVSPGATRRLIAQVISHGPHVAHPPALDALTGRELEVLALVAQGLSNDEIAERLVISPATARTHVSHILGKLEARDRAQLVVIAYQAGLVRPEAR